MLSLRRLGLGVALTALYVAAGKAGLALASVNVSASPVWPPAGIALAAALLWGPRVWPAIFAGAFIVNATTAGSFVTWVGLAVGNTLEALVAAWLINRFAEGRATFERAANVFKFVLFATIGAILAATTGVATLCATGFAAWTDFGPIWLTWCLGDATGMVAITPAIILWKLQPRVGWLTTQRVEAALLLATLLALCVFVLVRASLPLGFLCIPLAVWAGFRFGAREASTITLLMSLVAVWVTARGFGPFSSSSLNTGLLAVQTLTVTMAMLGLLVGAATSELRRAEGDVRQLNEDLERRVDARTAEVQAALDHLRASEARLAEAHKVARIGSWEWRLPGDVFWCSEELAGLFGIEAAGATYQTLLDLVHPDDQRRANNEVRNLRDHNIPLEVEYRITRPDGGQRVLVSRGRMLSGDDPTAMRLLGTVQDITERKQLEEELRQGQKMEAIGMLAGGIAHDFNNLLTAIGGYTELVMATLAENDSRRGDLLEVRKGAERAAALTRQLLAFSRRQLLQPRVLDLNALIVGVQKLLQRTIGEDVELVVDLASGIQAVRADPSQLEQVLLNLAVNARDAMPHGGQLRFVTRAVHIDEDRARLYPGSSPGSYVRLTVSDTGDGIPIDLQPRIFEPFFTTKERGKGTGLGLSTVYGIVRQSGGFLNLVSEVGRGTSFEIFVPAADQAIELAARAEPDALLPRGTETILLAEDDGAVRRLAQQILVHHGYTVVAARDGDEALVMAQGHRGPLDLLITDLLMPGISGRDLAIRLTADYPTLRILYTTGYADRTILPDDDDGRTLVLPKPFLPTDLLRKVREALDAPAPRDLSRSIESRQKPA